MNRPFQYYKSTVDFHHKAAMWVANMYEFKMEQQY